MGEPLNTKRNLLPYDLKERGEHLEKSAGMLAFEDHEPVMSLFEPIPVVNNTLVVPQQTTLRLSLAHDK